MSEEMLYDTRAHALLFSCFASELRRRSGNWEEILREAVVDYGKERGARMADRARKDGLPLSMSTYLLYREYKPEEDGSPQGQDELLENGDFHAVQTSCVWNNTWKELGTSECCAIYCDHIDRSLARGFSPLCVIDVPQSLARGNDCCHLWFRGAALADPRVEERMEKYGPLIGRSNAVKPWAYHLGHLYQTLSKTMALHMRDGELEALQKEVLRQFEEYYGEGSARCFLRESAQDFTDTSDYQGVAKEQK